ncbi:GAF domain-containing protein [Chloroflexus sp.]|uniref:GAF domain-containing protein n=1 Tax=Chloroflexus sp. TaxID=1904827 RepID=UPI003C72ED5A
MMRERWNATQARLLADIGSLLVSLSRSEAFQQIARRLVPLLGDWCIIIIRDEHHQPRRVAVVCADPSKQALAARLIQEAVLQETYSPPVQVLTTGQPLLLLDLPDDYSENPNFSPAYRELVRQIKPRQLLTLPIWVRDRVVGVLVLLITAPSQRHFTQDDLILATEIAKRLALAVENLFLYRSMQRRLDQLLLVQRVAGLVNSVLHTEKLCQLVVQQLHGTFGYHLVSIYLLQDGVLRLQAVVGYDQVLPVIQLHEGVAGRVMRTGQAEFVRDTTGDPDFIEMCPGTTQCIVVPLRHGEAKPVGVIIVESLGNPALDNEDFFLLSLLADQISIALINTMLFARMIETFERFRSLIELAGNAIICLNPQLHITEFNRMAEQLFGRMRSEMIGADFVTTLLSEAERPLFVALVREVKQGESTQSFETTFCTADGERYLKWTVTCRRQLNGELAELLLVCQDLTEQREMTEELLRYERRLQDLERLESLAIMAGGIAHDFNNLLSVIQGNAHLLKDTAAVPNSADHYLQNLLTATQQAGELVQQLLRFAAADPVELQQLDLNRLIEEAIPVLQTMLNRPAVIRLDLDPALPPIRADPVQIRQVLLNLVMNAVDALPERNGDICIQTALREIGVSEFTNFISPHQLTSGEYVTMAVHDNGCGINPALRQRIFEPFFTTKVRGHGLGLPSVLNIVRQHGGAIEVKSRPGEGSTFTVLFPPWQPRTAQGVLPIPVASSEPPCVLVVDDNNDVHSLIERLLRHAGYRVQAVVNGSEALQLVTQGQAIACALVDITLADISGYEVCRQIAERNPCIPLALISGYPVEAASIGEVSVAATLQKPFRAQELWSVVQRLIEIRAELLRKQRC